VSKIKKLFLKIIDFFKDLFNFSNLSENELNGYITPLTKIHFFPRTKVKVPFRLGRTIRGVSFNKNILLDPNGRLCKDISDGLESKVLYKNMAQILEKEKNCNAADIINLSNNKYLMNYPAWAIVLPWEKFNSEDKFKSYPKTFYVNRISKGFIFKNDTRKSIISMMYTSKFAENRVNQMKELFKRIDNDGYVSRDSDLPKINVLYKNGQWRWFMSDGGNHRSYILSCLNHELFTARIDSIINKNEVNDWHNVRNGIFSVSEAEDIFDSYFNGKKVLRGMV
tara:strand:- start:242 stop:1084 length:843 start_codon:yes stop_codon:yes gene_type:complete